MFPRLRFWLVRDGEVALSDLADQDYRQRLALLVMPRNSACNW